MRPRVLVLLSVFAFPADAQSRPVAGDDIAVLVRESLERFLFDDPTERRKLRGGRPLVVDIESAVANAARSVGVETPPGAVADAAPRRAHTAVTRGDVWCAQPEPPGSCAHGAFRQDVWYATVDTLAHSPGSDTLAVWVAVSRAGDPVMGVLVHAREVIFARGPGGEWRFVRLGVGRFT